MVAPVSQWFSASSASNGGIAGEALTNAELGAAVAGG